MMGQWRFGKYEHSTRANDDRAMRLLMKMMGLWLQGSVRENFNNMKLNFRDCKDKNRAMQLLMKMMGLWLQGSVREKFNNMKHNFRDYKDKNRAMRLLMKMMGLWLQGSVREKFNNMKHNFRDYKDKNRGGNVLDNPSDRSSALLSGLLHLRGLLRRMLLSTMAKGIARWRARCDFESLGYQAKAYQVSANISNIEASSGNKSIFARSPQTSSPSKSLGDNQLDVTAAAARYSFSSST